MRTVKGRYNGSVVVLDEPAPVSHEVEVQIQFPNDTAQGPEKPAPKKWHWEAARSRTDSLKGTVSEELQRQRQLD